MEIPPEMLAAHSALVPIVMAIPGVRGVDVGLREQDGVITDEIVLRVLVSDLANVPSGIPEAISGMPITIIQRNPQVEADLARYPTVVGGISISNLLSNGTLGGIARENTTGELRGITNEHVLGSVVGNAVFQPELTTLPPPAADRIGTIVRTSFPTVPSVLPPFMPIGFTDAACFSIERAAAALIQDIGIIWGSSVPQLNDRVRKRGKTTLLTHGIITGFGAYENRGAILSNQFEVTVNLSLSTEWSDSGDSGSLVVRESTGEVVGLHWGVTQEFTAMPVILRQPPQSWVFRSSGPFHRYRRYLLLSVSRRAAIRWSSMGSAFNSPQACCLEGCPPYRSRSRATTKSWQLHRLETAS